MHRQVNAIALHENVKVELDTYARESGRPAVKPFVLVIARDTTHAAELYDLAGQAVRHFLSYLSEDGARRKCSSSISGR